jgi:hypothetical protein
VLALPWRGRALAAAADLPSVLAPNLELYLWPFRAHGQTNAPGDGTNSSPWVLAGLTREWN